MTPLREILRDSLREILSALFGASGLASARGDDSDGEIGTVADERVDAPFEEPPHIRRIVDGPHFDGQASPVPAGLAPAPEEELAEA